MNPATQQTEMQVYGSNATYKSQPTNMATGHVPLDTLPAAWWNWLWNQITKNNNGSFLSIQDLRTEMENVLTEAGITPSALSSNQLLNAIKQLAQSIATVSTPGAVKSSSDIKSVSVDTDGTMVVNALADWSYSDTVKTKVDTAQTTANTAVSKADTAQSTANTAVSKADTAQSTADTAVSRLNNLATVATSGSYDDLSDKPTIPEGVTVDSALSVTSKNPVQNKLISPYLANFNIRTVAGSKVGIQVKNVVTEAIMLNSFINGLTDDGASVPLYIDDAYVHVNEFGITFD